MRNVVYRIRADRATPPISQAIQPAEVAAWAASRGWAVVKVIPGTKKAAEKWRELSWRDPETVRIIWGDYAVGILTGPSRLVCDDLDVDDEGNPAGEWNLENLIEGDWDKLPATFALNTPSGGRYLVWKAPRGREFKNAAGSHEKEGKLDVIPGAPYIDVRGRGGLFVLWDPTQPGRFVTDNRDPVIIPACLAKLHPEPGASVNGHIRSVDNVGARKWLKMHGGGNGDKPCEIMARTRDKWLDLFDEGLPHDVMTNAVYQLIGDCVLGHTGLNSALAELRDAFRAEVRGRKREREWLVDWRNAITTAIARKTVRGDPADDDPCDELARLQGFSPRRNGVRHG